MNGQQDWSTAIRKIEKSGLSQRQIAERLKVSQATVGRIKNQAVEPKFSTGSAILMCLGDLQIE